MVGVISDRRHHAGGRADPDPTEPGATNVGLTQREPAQPTTGVRSRRGTPTRNQPPGPNPPTATPPASRTPRMSTGPCDGAGAGPIEVQIQSPAAFYDLSYPPNSRACEQQTLTDDATASGLRVNGAVHTGQQGRHKSINHPTSKLKTLHLTGQPKCEDPYFEFSLPADSMAPLSAKFLCSSNIRLALARLPPFNTVK